MEIIYKILFYDYKTEQMIKLFNHTKNQFINNLRHIEEAENQGKCLLIDSGIKQKGI